MAARHRGGRRFGAGQAVIAPACSASMMASVISVVPAVLLDIPRVKVARRGRNFDRRLDPPGVVGQAEAIQHHRAARDGADRVTDTAAGDVRSGTVHGL